MQLKFVLFALLGSVFAQKEVFLGQLEAIHHALDSLDTTVIALKAGGDQAAATSALTSKSSAVLGAINSAITAVNGATPLDLAGASSIVGPADRLVKETEKTIQDLISKKDIIAANKQTATVLDQLKSQAAAAQKLADAISAKVPDATKAIAKTQASKISTAINSGVAAFS